MKLNPRNLVMSAMFGGRRGPRPAAGNPTSIACHDLMDAAGVSFPAAHVDASAMAELALAGHEIVGFDTVMPEYSVVQEAAAMGARIDWGDRDKMPDVKEFPNADFSNVAVPPDLLEKPACRVVLDALSILRRHVGGRAAIVGKVMGPWTMSYHMAGTQNFLLAVGMGESKKIETMLRQLMPVTIAFINAQFAAGADVVVLADHATRNLVGPHHYEQYLLPIHQEITAQVGGPIILHVCGNCSDRLELFARSGVDAYHFEWQVDSREAVRRVGDRIALAGNVNNPQALLQGTPEDVYKQARYAIDAGVNLIGPECAIPLSTPIENLKAIVAAVRAGW
jgi:[methyl-Co(III) methanol-specific corrinoid protein]:coenzyme M methyltransferase